MVHFAEINQVSCSYSMFQYTGRVATPKLVLRNCLRYLQTTLMMQEVLLVSEFMRYCKSTGLRVRLTLGTAIYIKLKSTI